MRVLCDLLFCPMESLSGPTLRMNCITVGLEVLVEEVNAQSVYVKLKENVNILEELKKVDQIP